MRFVDLVSLIVIICFLGFVLILVVNLDDDDCNVVPFVVQKEITNNYTCVCPEVDCTKEVRQMIDDVKILKEEIK